ncbi:thymidylate kinase isoform X1 [Ischnura elegans]|uniref:thymidylate kinase isoform X1 n=1 Tax=Ischnura elegans TaxID=197161 RepID=UPI001ED8BB2B|nr:thymidylate kinase isoform X1 [Ischnura elegans]
MRGSLIVLEGCDRVGKTTQCVKLIEKIAAYSGKASLLKFPDRSSLTGGLIDNYLRNKLELTDKVVHLLFSANRWELEPKMKNLLLNGTHLVVDRYAFSGVAYSAAKDGMDMEWCRSPDIGLPRPDLVVYLDLDPKSAASRIGYGEERYESRKFQEAVRNNFLKLKESYWMIVDARKSVDDMHEEIWDRVRKTIDECWKEPIEKLWC